MKKLLVNLMASFIPSKRKRHQFRRKCLSEKKVLFPTNLESENQNKILNALLSKIDILQEELNNVAYKQNLIMDYFLSAKKAMPATGALRKRQEQDVALLKEFVRICHSLKLDYWLDFGSLLGTVRHNGHCVPWDDDVDVSMTLESFEIFHQNVEKLLPENIQYVDLKWENHGVSRLVFKEDTGAFLDIYGYICDKNKVHSVGKFANKYYCRSIPNEVMYPLKQMTFEGIKVKVPNNPDSYLRIKYGNYEMLPKKAHTDSGHNFAEEYLKYYPEEE